MTPQEAREILQQIRKQKCVSECDCGCKLYKLETFCLEEKALDMAIKALEQTNNQADLQNAYDCGYNSGYTDAVNALAESEG